MATIDKLYKSMGLPMNIKRGNPWPLDVSSLWYSYDEMKAYAEDKAGVSYVGQVLALVDEENNTATAYIIANEDGLLKEVGSGPLVDNKTIVIDEESDEIGLKDFGKRFYKYVPEVKGEAGEVIKEAGYTLVDVDSEHPWASGLEPRVVSEDGKLVLGWFEPNPTTIEGVNNQVSSIQSSVADLQGVVENLVGEVGAPKEGSTEATGLYAELDKKANAADVYTKSEVRTEIALSVADSDHLRRKILTSYADIVAYKDTHDDADKYIFMVPNEDNEVNDVYEEYMVIEGVIEKVGDWKVDLTDYITKSALTTTLADYVTNTALNTKLDEFITEAELATELNSYVTNTNFAVAMADKVDVEEGKRLITEEEAAKLASLDTAGEANFVKEVSADFAVDDNGVLSLNKNVLDLSNNTTIKELEQKLNSMSNVANSNAASLEVIQKTLAANAKSIEDLETSTAALENAVAANTKGIKDLTSEQTNIKSKLDALTTKANNNESSINTILADLNKYVLKSTYEADIAEIRDILTWKDMEETSAA